MASALEFANVFRSLLVALHTYSSVLEPLVKFSEALIANNANQNVRKRDLLDVDAFRNAAAQINNALYDLKVLHIQSPENVVVTFYAGDILMMHYRIKRKLMRTTAHFYDLASRSEDEILVVYSSSAETAADAADSTSSSCVQWNDAENWTQVRRFGLQDLQDLPIAINVGSELCTCSRMKSVSKNVDEYDSLFANVERLISFVCTNADQFAA